ncbi:MAG TPA: molybdopterin-dependent oxidoreductase [Motiliproteus sp.]
MARLRTLLALSLWLGCFPLHAAPLAKPEGNVLLTVSGLISELNTEGMAQFDRGMLDQLPQHAMTTATPWTEGIQRFEGPLLSDLLAAVGSSGNELVLRALNDYFAIVNLDEIANYPVMLAMRVNGAILSVRNKGPIWLVYPMSEYPELDTPYHRPDMVWQLIKIEVR